MTGFSLINLSVDGTTVKRLWYDFPCKDQKIFEKSWCQLNSDRTWKHARREWWCRCLLSVSMTFLSARHLFSCLNLGPGKTKMLPHDRFKTHQSISSPPNLRHPPDTTGPMIHFANEFTLHKDLGLMGQS